MQYQVETPVPTAQETRDFQHRLRRAFRTARDRWRVLLALTVLLGSAGFILAATSERQYQATSLLVHKPQESERALSLNPELGSAPQRSSQEQVVDLATLRRLAVAAPVLRRIGEAPTSGLTGNPYVQDPAADEDAASDAFSVGSDVNTSLLRLSYRDRFPERAARVANEWADAFIAERAVANQAPYSDALRLVRQKIAADEELARRNDEPRSARDDLRRALQRQLQTLEVASALQQPDVRLVQRAQTPLSPLGVSAGTGALIGGLLGLIVGGLVVAALEAFDRRLKTSEDVADAWGSPMLATIPPTDLGKLRSPERDVSDIESFRHLQAALMFASVDRRTRTILVTSATAGEGKSVTAAGLALTLCGAGFTTLLVDADMRNRRLTREWDIDGPGLSNVLAGAITLPDAVRQVEVADPDSNGAPIPVLSVLGAGAPPPNPLQLLSSHRAGDLIDAELRQGWDFVVIDSAPVLAVGDTVPLVSHVDGVLGAAMLYASRSDAARRAAGLVGRAGGSVLGVVVAAGRHYGHDEYGYGYGYLGDESRGSRTRSLLAQVSQRRAKTTAER